MRYKTWTPAILAAVVSQPTLAQSLFQVEVNATDSSGTQLIVGGSTLPKLVENLLDTEAQFQSFDGRPFEAMLRYAGIDNAVNFTLDGEGDDATLRFTILGDDATTHVFTGDDIGEQVKDFLLKDSPAELSNFMKAVSQRSPIAVTDGNPLATTARAARYSFDRFGLHADLIDANSAIAVDFRASQPDVGPNPDTEAPRPRRDRKRGLIIRGDSIGGVISTPSADAWGAQIALSMEAVLADRFSVVLGLPFAYHSVEDADVFNAAAHLGVPIGVVLADENDRGLSWTLTPSTVLAVSGSYDFAAGAWLYGLAGTSLLSYKTEHWTFSLANQFGAYESLTAKYDGYEFDAGIEQQITRHGLAVARGLGERWYAYGSIARTDFLEEAAVDSYWTPGAGVGIRSANGFNFRIGYEGDYGDDYTAHQWRMTLRMPF